MLLLVWGNKITLVREHYKATQMLPEVILRHCGPTTFSRHDTLNHQNVGEIVANIILLYEEFRLIAPSMAWLIVLVYNILKYNYLGFPFMQVMKYLEIHF